MRMTMVLEGKMRLQRNKERVRRWVRRERRQKVCGEVIKSLITQE